MGFDVHASEAVGKVAVADLTPIKQREKEEKAKAAQSPKVATMQVKKLCISLNSYEYSYLLKIVIKIM